MFNISRPRIAADLEKRERCGLLRLPHQSPSRRCVQRTSNARRCHTTSNEDAIAPIQELLEIKDTHCPRVLPYAYAKEHRTTLGAVRVLDFE